MAAIQRIWTQDTSFDEKKYLDKLTVYDGGDFVGYLVETSQGKQWSGYSVKERRRESPQRYVEILQPAHDFFVPMGFFSIETYPALVKGSLLWIPGWKVQMESVPPTSGLPSFPPPLPQPQPQPQTLNPKRRQPYPPPCPPPLPPSLPAPPKSPSETPVLLQRPSQSKSKNASKQRVLSSSSSTFHETLKLSSPEKQEGSLLPPSPVDHIVQQSQWYPLFQLSLSPLPHAIPEVPIPPLTSSSPRPSNSEQSLPSRQVQRRSANKPRHPTFSKTPSHAQTA